MMDQDDYDDYGFEGLVSRGTTPQRLGRSLFATRIPRQAGADRALVADGGSPGTGHSVWLRPTGGLSAPLFPASELPAWGFDRIITQFAVAGARLGICQGPGPGHTGMDPVPDTRWAPDWLRSGELHSATEPPPTLDLALVIADPCPHEPPATNEVAGPFWRTLRQAVRPGGLVLVHTHQHHTLDGLLDPAGALVRDASRYGLGYLQHHVLVHTPLLSRTLGAADPAPRNTNTTGPVHRRVHTDLLAFLAPA